MIEDREVYNLLTRPARIKRMIRRIDAEINALTLSFALPKAITYDKDPVQTSPDDAMSGYMAHKDELVRKREKAVADYETAVKEVGSWLDLLECEAGALIISLRFLEGRGFTDISEEIHRSERQMYRDYNDALEELSDKLKVGSKCQ